LRNKQKKKVDQQFWIENSQNGDEGKLNEKSLQTFVANNNSWSNRLERENREMSLHWWHAKKKKKTKNVEYTSSLLCCSFLLQFAGNDMCDVITTFNVVTVLILSLNGDGQRRKNFLGFNRHVSSFPPKIKSWNERDTFNDMYLI
jgi:hypothetical protein